MGQFVPCWIRHHRDSALESITLGHPLLDDYLAFVAVRARTNTWLAVASDLKIFFGVVAKPPTEVTAADVFEFLSAQRSPATADGSCDSMTVRRACRPGPLLDGSRVCVVCTRTCRPGEIPA